MQHADNADIQSGRRLKAEVVGEAFKQAEINYRSDHSIKPHLSALTEYRR